MVVLEPVVRVDKKCVTKLDENRSISRRSDLHLRLFCGVQLLKHGRVACNLFLEEEIIQDTAILPLERVGGLDGSSLNKESNASLFTSVAVIYRDLYVAYGVNTQKNQSRLGTWCRSIKSFVVCTFKSLRSMSKVPPAKKPKEPM